MPWHSIFVHHYKFTHLYFCWVFVQQKKNQSRFAKDTISTTQMPLVRFILLPKVPTDVCLPACCIPNLFSYTSFVDLHFIMCQRNANANSTKPLIVSMLLYLYLHPSSTFPSPHVQISPEHASTSLIGSIGPLVSLLPSLTHSLRLSSSPASLDMRRVTWTFQIGVSTPLPTSLFFSYIFPSSTPTPTLLTIFNFFFSFPRLSSLVPFLLPSLIY